MEAVPSALEALDSEFRVDGRMLCAACSELGTVCSNCEFTTVFSERSAWQFVAFFPFSCACSRSAGETSQQADLFVNEHAGSVNEHAGSVNEHAGSVSEHDAEGYAAFISLSKQRQHHYWRYEQQADSSFAHAELLGMHAPPMSAFRKHCMLSLLGLKGLARISARFSTHA
eukprot:4929292-Pleurochrysis_carterae.AAC.1